MVAVIWLCGSRSRTGLLIPHHRGIRRNVSAGPAGNNQAVKNLLGIGPISVGRSQQGKARNLSPYSRDFS